MEISQASIEQLDDMVLLFDQYRGFYRQNSDLEQAKEFITARLQQQDSVILLATEVTNKSAQNLYESMGYRQFDEFYHYVLAIAM